MRIRPSLLIAAFLAGFLVAHVYPLLMAATAAAQDFLVLTVRSYHFDRDRNYNENNLGLGIERRLNENWSASTGFYRNSYDRTTVYAFGAYTPMEIAGWRMGAIAGGVTGYDSGISPWFSGVAMRDFGRIGVNLVFAASGIALQVKLRIGQ